MLKSTRKALVEGMVAVAAVATLVAIGSDMASAGGEKTYKPLQAIDETVGSKHVVAVYEKGGGECRVQLMIEEAQGADGNNMLAAARVRFVLEPDQAAFLDSAENQSVSFTCSEGAEALRVVQSDRVFAALNE
jgi:hypothetical protein